MKRNKICLMLILCFIWHLASTQTLTEILNDIKWKNYIEIENKIQKNQSTKNAPAEALPATNGFRGLTFTT